jgi:hypothetical protein
MSGANLDLIGMNNGLTPLYLSIGCGHETVVGDSYSN